MVASETKLKTFWLLKQSKFYSALFPFQDGFMNKSPGAVQFARCNLAKGAPAILLVSSAKCFSCLRVMERLLIFSVRDALAAWLFKPPMRIYIYMNLGNWSSCLPFFLIHEESANCGPASWWLPKWRHASARMRTKPNTCQHTYIVLHY